MRGHMRAGSDDETQATKMALGLESAIGPILTCWWSALRFWLPAQVDNSIPDALIKFHSLLLHLHRRKFIFAFRALYVVITKERLIQNGCECGLHAIARAIGGKDRRHIKLSLRIRRRNAVEPFRSCRNLRAYYCEHQSRNYPDNHFRCHFCAQSTHRFAPFYSHFNTV